MDNTEDTVQISMSFHFLQESFIAKMMFLLQVDNYESYKLVGSFEKYIELLNNNMSFKVHYKVFKNTPLNSMGYVSNNDPGATKNVTYVDSSYYFVVKNNTFEKDQGLFLETLRQMCMYSSSQQNYFNYMREITNKCFLGPNEVGNFEPVKDFVGCTDDIYDSMIYKKNKNLDRVNLLIELILLLKLFRALL